MKQEEDIYQIDVGSEICFLIEGTLFVLALSFLFYESIWAALFLSPIIWVIYTRKVKQKKQQLKWKLNLQFKDALSGMTAALGAGYSVENSIAEALIDLRCIYKDTDLIVKEFERMHKQLQLNATIEQVFFEFAKRSQIDDISNFAWILYTAKRSGGDLIKITKSTSNMISERIEVNGEIKTVIAAKRLESNIMSLVPAGIIVYLKLGSAEFLDPLYGNAAGILVMSLVLVLYALAYLLSTKIVHIQV